jgi:aerobic-type carbon monoxide dehydrogenase small subunit (CoxS/CutS family)
MGPAQIVAVGLFKEVASIDECFRSDHAPGFVLMTQQLLDENSELDDDDIKYYLAGNLCRCAAYPEIIQAVKAASKKREKRI